MPDALNIQNTIKALLTESFNMNTAIFASLNKNGISETHHDMESVFLIPTHGLVNYVIYEGEKFIRSFSTWSRRFVGYSKKYNSFCNTSLS